MLQKHTFRTRKRNSKSGHFSKLNRRSLRKGKKKQKKTCYRNIEKVTLNKEGTFLGNQLF